MENQTDVLDEPFLKTEVRKRKDLLPGWIKVFMWIFLISGALSPFAFILGILGNITYLSLYGFETNEALSIPGVVITLLFALKGITSYGLLTEKDWAIKVGIADAVLGIVLCTASMVYVIINAGFTLRLELLLLIPYLNKMLKIKGQWEN